VVGGGVSLTASRDGDIELTHLRWFDVMDGDPLVGTAILRSG
jgi:hypothetical protein